MLHGMETVTERRRVRRLECLDARKSGGSNPSTLNAPAVQFPQLTGGRATSGSIFGTQQFTPKNTGKVKITWTATFSGDNAGQDNILQTVMNIGGQVLSSPSAPIPHTIGAEVTGCAFATGFTPGVAINISVTWATAGATSNAVSSALGNLVIEEIN